MAGRISGGHKLRGWGGRVNTASLQGPDGGGTTCATVSPGRQDEPGAQSNPAPAPSHPPSPEMNASISTFRQLASRGIVFSIATLFYTNEFQGQKYHNGPVFSATSSNDFQIMVCLI